jgi:hypothetical protein
LQESIQENRNDYYKFTPSYPESAPSGKVNCTKASNGKHHAGKILKDHDDVHWLGIFQQMLFNIPQVSPALLAGET